MATPLTISGIVRIAVERHGYKDVREELGVTHASVNKWVRGVGRPQKSRLVRLAALADVPLPLVERAWQEFSGDGPRLEKRLDRLQAREEALRQEIEELRRELRRLQ